VSKAISSGRWRGTYAYALAGGLLATFTITPALGAIILPSHMRETETRIMAFLHRSMFRC